MYISYSGYKLYTACQLAYWHKYIAQTKLPAPDNQVNTLFGNIIGSLFEAYYNENLGANPALAEGILQARVGKYAQEMVHRVRRYATVKWKAQDPKAMYASSDELLRDLHETVAKGLKTIVLHNLWSHGAKAEVVLDHTIQGNVLAGRADFIGRNANGVYILDGKGSKYRELFVDKRQLLWYAMLYEAKNKELPSTLGFVHWRSDPEKAVDWVPYKAEDLVELKAKVHEDIAKIEEAKKKDTPFEPTVDLNKTKKQCYYCVFAPLCPRALAVGTVEDVTLD